MQVYTITKGNNKTYVYDIYHGQKGDKGDQGIQGIQGVQGIQGIQGNAATVQVGTVTMGEQMAVVNSGTVNDAVLDFTLVKGDKGDKGQAAGFGTPVAFATPLPIGSTPTASVTAAGDPTQKVFTFEFGIPSGGEDNVQSDWTQTDTTADDYIKNKPTLATVATSGSYTDLTNKPSLATVATSGSYTDLSNRPTIPTVAASIADGETGYTTGDQVYEYLEEHKGYDVWELSVTGFGSSSITLKLLKNLQGYSGTVFLDIKYGDGSTVTTVNGVMPTFSSGSAVLTASDIPDLSTILANASNKFFLFEGKETYSGAVVFRTNFSRTVTAVSVADGETGYATGDQVYEALQTAGNDVWEVAYHAYTSSKYHYFSLFKNGQRVTSGNFYVELTGNRINGGMNTFGEGKPTYSAPQWYILADNNPNDNHVSITISVYENSVYGTRLCVGTIPVRASSIADNVNGYTTGDQVYDYVAAQVGDITTILESL